MKVGVIGRGAVGGRVLRQLPKEEAFEHSGDNMDFSGLDVLVLTTDSQSQLAYAGAAIAQGVCTISTADRPDTVSALLELDSLAKEKSTLLFCGAAYSPGLSCVLAAHLASKLDKVTDIHIARVGTGGPSCARNFHRALRAMSLEYCEGRFKKWPGGSGRELCWFPEPLGGLDCYKGAFSEPILLAPIFSDARRITARRAATRQDRLTSPFPMLSPPHIEGGLGGIRVEVRGIKSGQPKDLVAGSIAVPALAAAKVILSAIDWLKAGKTSNSGAMGLAGAISPRDFLADLMARGISISSFEGLSSFEGVAS